MCDALPAEGDILTGTIATLTDYGAWVDLPGGAQGLLLLPDITWGRLRLPADLLQAGAPIAVVVLRVDAESQRVSLSRKALSPDPWAVVPDRLPPGTVTQGRVVFRGDWGLFVEVLPDVEGLVHFPEWSRPVSTQDEITVRVLEVDMESRRMKLAMCPPPE